MVERMQKEDNLTCDARTLVDHIFKCTIVVQKSNTENT